MFMLSQTFREEKFTKHNEKIFNLQTARDKVSKDARQRDYLQFLKRSKREVVNMQAGNISERYCLYENSPRRVSSLINNSPINQKVFDREY